MIDFKTLQNATHPILVFQPQGMNINVNLSGGVGQPIGWNGPLQVTGTVLDGCLPTGWAPSAMALSACGSREPWVMMPVAALDKMIRSQLDGTHPDLKKLEAPPEPKVPVPLTGLRSMEGNLVLDDRHRHRIAGHEVGSVEDVIGSPPE